MEINRPLDEVSSYTFDLGPVESVLIVFENTRKNLNLPVWQPLHQTIATLSPTDLSKGWDVTLCHNLLNDTITVHFDTLFDLKDSEEYQHFCGTIIYRKTIDSGRDVARNVSTILDLGLIEGVSEVFVNGQSIGAQYFGRRLYDLGDDLHNGANDLEIRVTTTLGNYLKTLIIRKVHGYVTADGIQLLAGRDLLSEGEVTPTEAEDGFRPCFPGLFDGGGNDFLYE